MDTRHLASVAGPPLAAAVLGNAFVGKDAVQWYRELDAPSWQLPLPAFGLVAAVYYGQLGVVLHRARRRGDRRTRRRALVVLAGNEVWNVAFLGRRSTRNGFAGMLLYLVPLLRLQAAVAGDRTSLAALTPYTLFVLAYDVPWSYRLWRLNPAGPGHGDS